MKISKASASIIVVVLFHAVGFAGFLIPGLRPVFLMLVPWHLLLMMLVVLVNHNRHDIKLWVFVLLIYIGGMVAEWMGVHSGWIFGDYNYGKTLGPKLYDIPLTIGVNWFVLIYATGVLMQRSRLTNVLIRVLLGALLMVILDVLIEPVAIKFDYWHWAQTMPPLKNYIGWFALSVLFLSVFERFCFKVQNSVAAVLLLVQFVFFELLQWV